MKKTFYLSIFFSFFITYMSLFIPRNVEVNRPDIIGCETVCTIAAGGFPFVYIIDGYTSPVGTISKNPFIVIFTNTDIFFLKKYILNFTFWFILIYIIICPLKKYFR